LSRSVWLTLVGRLEAMLLKSLTALDAAAQLPEATADET
jgi:hypothetical protein